MGVDATCHALPAGQRRATQPGRALGDLPELRWDESPSSRLSPLEELLDSPQHSKRGVRRVKSMTSSK